MDYHSRLKTPPLFNEHNNNRCLQIKNNNPHLQACPFGSYDLCYTHLALDAILKKKQEIHKKFKLYLWPQEWSQTSATIAVVVGLKSLATAIGFGLRSNTGRARSKTLDFLQILRKEKVGKARILNYLCSFDVLSQEIAATAAVRTSLWSKGCKFEHKKIIMSK